MVQQKALDLLVGKGGGHSITGQNPADLLLRVAVQPGQTGVFGVHFLIAHSDVLGLCNGRHGQHRAHAACGVLAIAGPQLFRRGVVGLAVQLQREAAPGKLILQLLQRVVGVLVQHGSRHKRRPVLKRVLVAAMTLVILTLGALAVSADFRKAVYTMIQKFLPIEMQLTYQVDGEPLERLPDGYSDHYVPDGFEMDDAQKFERAENFLHVYSSKETEESYTVRCSIIQPGQQSLFDNEHTVYETVKVGEADGVLGTSTDEHGKNVYTLSWEHRGITHTVMGNIPYDEIMKIAEGIR